MRNSKIITLDENRTVTVKELRVREVRNLLAGFTDLDKLDAAALFGPHFAEISALLEPFIIFPSGESLDDLSGSELTLVIDGLKKVNHDFLVLAGMTVIEGSVVPVGEIEQTEYNLTEPAAV
jgi:hypothetical protein